MTTPRSQAVSEIATRVPSTRTSWQSTLSTSWFEPCYSLSLASVKSRLVLPFWYRLTRVVPNKGPRACVCVCNDTTWSSKDLTLAYTQNDPPGVSTGLGDCLIFHRFCTVHVWRHNWLSLSDRQARACKKFREILGPANEDLLTQAQLAQSFMQIELS